MDLVGNKSLRDTWDRLAQAYPEKTAIVFEDISGKTSELSYAEFNHQINQAANLFLKLGVKKGDRVATQLFNSPEFLASWFGLAKIGAITVPINVQSLHHEASYILKKCQIEMVIAEKQFVSLYQEISQKDGIPLEHILITRIEKGEEPDGTLNFGALLRSQSTTLEKIVPLDSFLRDA